MGIQQSPFYVSRRIETMKQVIFACLLAVVAINSVDAKRGNKGKGRDKGKDAETGEKMTEICKTAEVGSDMAFKCSCLAVMKTPVKDRTDEQKATGKDCREKRKEKMEAASAAGDKTEVTGEKVQKWKAKVKACRNIRKANKEGHAEADKLAWAEENCKMTGGKKRGGGRKKGGKKEEEEKEESDENSEGESDAESDEEKKGGKGGKDGKGGNKKRGNRK